MGDRNFLDAETLDQKERGEETVHASEELDGTDGIRPKNFQGTASILNPISENPSPRIVGDRREKPSVEVIMAPLPPSADAVGLFKRLQQERNIVGIVLAIGVKGDQNLSLSSLQAGIKSGALSRPMLQTDSLYRPMEPFDGLPCAIR